MGKSLVSCFFMRHSVDRAVSFLLCCFGNPDISAFPMTLKVIYLLQDFSNAIRLFVCISHGFN